MQNTLWLTETLAYLLLAVVLCWAKGWKTFRSIFYLQAIRTALMLTHNYIHFFGHDSYLWWEDFNHVDLVLDLLLFHFLSCSKAKALDVLGWGYGLVLCTAICEYALVDNRSTPLANSVYWHLRAPLVTILDLILPFVLYAIYCRHSDAKEKQ